MFQKRSVDSAFRLWTTYIIPDLIGHLNIIRLQMYRMAMLYVFLKKFLTLWIQQFEIMKRCFYDDRIVDFLNRKDEEILGVLSRDNDFDLTLNQRDAWLEEIALMKEALTETGLSGHIVFEYTIPRLGKRIDVVLLVKHLVFCIEFKVGEDCINVNDKEQVWDYALDLKNFHEESAGLTIVSTKLVPGAKNVGDRWFNGQGSLHV